MLLVGNKSDLTDLRMSQIQIDAGIVNISSLLGKKINNRQIKGSMDFSQFLLEEEKVAVVPGIAFGSDNFLRLSYATSMDDIAEGLARIKEFIGNLESEKRKAKNV